MMHPSPIDSNNSILNESDDALILKPLKRRQKLIITQPKPKRTRIAKECRSGMMAVNDASTSSSIMHNFKSLVKSPEKGIPPTEIENINLKLTNNSTPEACGEVGDTVKSTSFSNSHNTDFTEAKLKPVGGDTKVCVLCIKPFRTESARISHMKLCAKKKNISTAELLNYIENNKVYVPSPKKTKQSPKVDDNPDDVYKLAVAAALSISSHSDSSMIADRRVINAQKATLEKFGFTSSNLPCGSRRRKGAPSSSVLRLRTIEDRQKLLTEKAAVVLLSEDELKRPTAEIVVPSQQEKLSFQSVVPKLWDLSGTNENVSWYTEGFREHLNEENSRKSSTSTVNLSYECRSTLPTPDTDLTNFLGDFPSSNTLSEDWKKMVNNTDDSNVVITTQDGQLYAHSLVLRARCPRFLDIEYSTALSCMPSSAVLLVLEFIYTGKLKSLFHSQLAPAIEIAQLVQCVPLLDFLTAIKDAADKDKPCRPCSRIEHDPLQRCSTADEADTIPNTRVESEPEENRSEMIDLTQSTPPRIDDDESNVPEKSVWDIISNEKEREDRYLDDDLQDSITHAHELEKIEVLMKRRADENQTLVDNIEKVELEEIKSEREKILNISRSSEALEQDLFAIDDQDEIKIIDKPMVNTEIINVPSESESEDLFGGTTDEDNTEFKAGSHVSVSPEIPCFDPPEFDDYYFIPSQPVCEAVPSQSLIGSTSSPKTPRKVLENFSDSPPRKKTIVNESPSENVENGTVDADLSPIFLEKTIISVEPTTKVRARRCSRKSLRRIKRVSAARRSVNRKLSMDKRLESPRGGKLLSNSVIAGLEQPWDSNNVVTTPKTTPGPYIEVTPDCTSSVKLVNNVTPRPNYSTMKSSTLKKHLQRYGLKKSLGQTKARKILRHIYDELHPVVNTRNGKIVKMRSTENKTKVRRKTTIATRRKGENKQGLKEKTAPSSKVRVEQDEGKKAAADHTSESDIELSTSFSTEDEGSGSTNDEFADGDDVLTQSKPAFSLEDAMSKYMNEHPGFYERILMYEPIWLEEVKAVLKKEYDVKYKLTDIVAYLDQKCITFRSATQAANNQKRNERRKVRLQNKREKEVEMIL